MKNKRQFMKGRNSLCAIFFLLFFSLRLLAGEVAGKKISVSFSNIPLKEAILKIVLPVVTRSSMTVIKSTWVRK